MTAAPGREAQEQSSFGAAGLTTVLLPSGYRVRGVIPGLADLARRGLLTTRAISAVARLTSPEWLTEAPGEEKAENLAAYVDVLVAGFPREAQDPGPGGTPAPDDGEWKSARLTVEDLSHLDQRDRDRLEDLVMRVRTADQITRATLGDDDDTEESALDAVVTFLSQRQRPSSRHDRTGMERSAVRPPRRVRRRARVLARRGPRAQVPGRAAEGPGGDAQAQASQAPGRADV